MRVDGAGAVRIQLRFDVLAYLLEEKPDEATSAEMAAVVDGPPEQLASRLADAEKQMRSDLKVVSDSSNLTLDSVRFPSAEDVKKAALENGPARFPVMLTVPIRAHLAPQAFTLSLTFPELLGTVVLTTELPYQEPISEPVEAGNASTSLRLPTPQQTQAAAAAMLAQPTVKAARASEKPKRQEVRVAPSTAIEPKPKPVEAVSLKKVAAKPITPAPTAAVAEIAPVEATPVVRPAFAAAPQGPSWGSLLVRYVRMGFHHILPLGLDHVLFVLGLFLLSTRTKDLLKQISAFTVAHSITLGLSLYGIVQLPRGVVEPLIALSIAFVAVENLYSTKMRAWRPLVVFGFGLVHGLGFASALRETGLAHGDFLVGLVGFNVGVEFGQLAVVAAAFAAVGWLRHSPRYRMAVVVPASAAIAAVALFWTLQRAL